MPHLPYSLCVLQLQNLISKDLIDQIIPLHGSYSVTQWLYIHSLTARATPVQFWLPSLIRLQAGQGNSLPTKLFINFAEIVPSKRHRKFAISILESLENCAIIRIPIRLENYAYCFYLSIHMRGSICHSELPWVWRLTRANVIIDSHIKSEQRMQ